MTTATLSVRPHTRRKPEDPYKDVRAERTERIRIAVAVERMEREIAEMVKLEFEQETV